MLESPGDWAAGRRNTEINVLCQTVVLLHGRSLITALNGKGLLKVHFENPPLKWGVGAEGAGVGGNHHFSCYWNTADSGLLVGKMASRLWSQSRELKFFPPGHLPPSYPGALKELLVVSVELKRLLEVQVGGGQRDGEVDSAHVGQDGVLWQGLQRHAGVLHKEIFFFTCQHSHDCLKLNIPARQTPVVLLCMVN